MNGTIYAADNNLSLTLTQLERRLAKNTTPRVLMECVGTIEEHPTMQGKFVVEINLWDLYDMWMVKAALTDHGIDLRGPKEDEGKQTEERTK